MNAGALPRIALAVLAAAVLVAGLAVSSSASNALHLGLIQEANSDRVLSVDPGSVAASIGIRAGDVVTAIGGMPVGTSPAVIGGELPVSLRQGSVIAVRWAAVPPSGRFWPGALLLLVAAAFWLGGLFATIRGPRGTATFWFGLFAFLAALSLIAILAGDPPVSFVRSLLPPAVFGAVVSYIWLQRALEGDPFCLRRDRLRLLLSAQAGVVALAVDAGPRLVGAAAGPVLAAIAGAHLSR
jgi:hypothetical protein